MKVLPATTRSVLRVTWPSLVVMLVMLVTAIGSILALSAMRSYVARHAVWAGAERDTATFLNVYATDPTPAHLLQVNDALAIGAGDTLAVTELTKPQPDYELVRQGFRQAKVGGNDIPGMIGLFRVVRAVHAGDDLLQTWIRSDEIYGQYRQLWQDIQVRLNEGPAAAEDIERWRDVTRRTHDALVPLERRFSREINDSARLLADWLMGFLVVSSTVFLSAGYWATHRIIANTEQIASALQTEQERAAVLLSSISDAVISTDRHGVVQFLNEAAEQLTGWNLAEAQGKQLGEVFRLLDSGDTQTLPMHNAIERVLSQGEPIRFTAQGAQLIRRDGSTRPIGERAAPVKGPNGEILGMVVVMRDVTPERQLSDQLRHQALHDALTALPNRVQFEQRLELALKQARNQGISYAAMFVDLDQFKIVNDTCGHHAGDELIRNASAAIQRQLRDGDLVARLGGDEFGVVLKSVTAEDTILIAERIRQGVEELRFAHEGRIFNVGASIGVVHNDPTLQSVTDVLCAADRACYAAKEGGRNQVRLYSSDDSAIDTRHGEMQWIARLNTALDQNRLELYAQEIRPLSNTTRNGRSSYELLLRLRDEEGRLVTPGAFIPAAERFGLMPRIDRWVIERACREQQRRLRAGLPTPLCMINLSSASIDNVDIAEFIAERLREHGLPSGSIGFELTETTAIGKLSTAVEVMNKLKQLGCPVALDDFGSGMSSYGYLRELPVDILKIDGSFVRDMGRDAVAYAMVEAMHNVARAAGLRTVAEWVEDENTINALTLLNIDFVQGRAIGREQPWSVSLEGEDDTSQTAPLPLPEFASI